MGIITISSNNDLGIVRELLDALNIQANNSHYAYLADIALQESWGSDYADDEQQGYIDAEVELINDSELDSLAASGISDEGKEYLKEHVRFAALHVNYYFTNTYTLNVEYVMDAGRNVECIFDIVIELTNNFAIKSGYISYEDSYTNNKTITMLLLRYG